jgi:hypothetical protein
MAGGGGGLLRCRPGASLLSCTVPPLQNAGTESAMTSRRESEGESMQGYLALKKHRPPP